MFSRVLLHQWAEFDVVTRITNLPHRQASQDAPTTPCPSYASRQGLHSISPVPITSCHITTNFAIHSRSLPALLPHYQKMTFAPVPYFAVPFQFFIPRTGLGPASSTPLTSLCHVHGPPLISDASPPSPSCNVITTYPPNSHQIIPRAHGPSLY